MTDFSKIETKPSTINTMTAAEIKEYFDNHQEQVANWLEVIGYLEKAQHTKLWHEQIGDLMQKYKLIRVSLNIPINGISPRQKMTIFQAMW